jgi:EAL domain-containing protein (putative c-di-GMP-specific phosphodiesterase class I)
VVEGIETVEQLDIVRQIGSDHAQGYFIAEPAPAEQVTAALELRQSGAGLVPER